MLFGPHSSLVLPFSPADALLLPFPAFVCRVHARLAQHALRALRELSACFFWLSTACCDADWRQGLGKSLDRAFTLVLAEHGVLRCRV